MEIKPVARFRAPLGEKFGLPRQAGLAESLRGTVVLEPAFRSPDALRGLEDFDFLWLIWEFHLNRETSGDSLTVRPPRLGGNERVGVFASRAPYRPNRLGLSSVRIESVDPPKAKSTSSAPTWPTGRPSTTSSLTWPMLTAIPACAAASWTAVNGSR